jgi:hypothetical protein
MANENHLELLRQGVDAWNAWREKNSSVSPDLASAPLQPYELSGANLQGANLHRADLSGTTLVGANLNLSRADLSGGDLRGANLSRANRTFLRPISATPIFWGRTSPALISALKGVSLDSANLRQANLPISAGQRLLRRTSCRWTSAARTFAAHG